MDIETHCFFGTSSDFVVVVAGIHGTEQSGVEIAHWMRVKLAGRSAPTRLGAIIVPDIFFAARNVAARAVEWNRGSIPADDWRELFDEKKRKLFPARMFPPPGKPFSFLGKDRFLQDENNRVLTVEGVSKIPVRPEIEYLTRLVETVRPVRIVSVHGKFKRTATHLTKARDAHVIDWSDEQIAKWDGTTAVKGVNFPGIFVDPRYAPGDSCRDKLDFEGCKFDKKLDPAFPLEGDGTKRFDSARTDDGRSDDAVALAAAKAVAKHGTAALVAGNHLDDPAEVVHYAKEGGTPQAFSLGDWGPVAVGGKDGSRSGAPVFTIETKDDGESWAFLDGVQYVTEDGKALPSPGTPEEHAKKSAARPYPRPKKFDPARSQELQAYADGIIDTILELP